MFDSDGITPYKGLNLALQYSGLIFLYNGWHAEASELSAHAGSWQLQVVAICKQD